MRVSSVRASPPFPPLLAAGRHSERRIRRMLRGETTKRSDLDPDTRAVTQAALAKLRNAGVTLVDVEMPDLMARNAAVGAPIVLYEAHDDLVGYLARYEAGVDIAKVAAGILSPDVKGFFDAFVLPRKLPTADGSTAHYSKSGMTFGTHLEVCLFRCYGTP